MSTKQGLDIVRGVYLMQKRNLHTIPRELIGVWPLPLSQAVPLPVYAEELGIPQAAACGWKARLLPGAIPGSWAQPLQLQQHSPLLIRPHRAAWQEEVSHGVASAGQIINQV